MHMRVVQLYMYGMSLINCSVFLIIFDVCYAYTALVFLNSWSIQILVPKYLGWWLLLKRIYYLYHVELYSEHSIRVRVFE